eukprot:31103-Pelagococcus_subviridis.AAC.14
MISLTSFSLSNRAAFSGCLTVSDVSALAAAKTTRLSSPASGKREEDVDASAPPPARASAVRRRMISASAPIAPHAPASLAFASLLCARFRSAPMASTQCSRRAISHRDGMTPNARAFSRFAALAHASARNAATASRRSAASVRILSPRRFASPLLSSSLEPTSSPSLSFLASARMTEIGARDFLAGRWFSCTSLRRLSVPGSAVVVVVGGGGGGISSFVDSETSRSVLVRSAPASRSTASASASPNSNAHAAGVRFHRSHASIPPFRGFNDAHAAAATRVQDRLLVRVPRAGARARGEKRRERIRAPARGGEVRRERPRVGRVVNDVFNRRRTIVPPARVRGQQSVDDRRRGRRERRGGRAKVRPERRHPGAQQRVDDVKRAEAARGEHAPTLVGRRRGPRKRSHVGRYTVFFFFFFFFFVVIVRDDVHAVLAQVRRVVPQHRAREDLARRERSVRRAKRARRGLVVRAKQRRGFAVSQTDRPGPGPATDHAASLAAAAEPIVRR